MFHCSDHFQAAARGSARLLIAAVAWHGGLSGPPCRAESLRGSDTERVSFNEHIRPIFAKHCVSCHGGVKQASGLSLVYRDSAVGECDSGLAPIVPGKPEESYLLDRVREAEPDMRMPPAEHGPALMAEQTALIERWIAQGAEWELHWAFEPPRAVEIPAVDLEHWPRDPLDRFVLARLEGRVGAPSGVGDPGYNWRPAVEASKAAWLRRASLDLTGVPPSPEEYEAFELDNRADAYERVVDRLLASPRYGERWAAMWLDLARYADTVGFERDPHRNIWPYRDWLIRALNEDMPLDEFTVKQLAGDLLPNATLGDRLATAFHRNTQTNTEGGTDDEEYRTAAVIDRVSTTWQVWQAMTFGCAQCHDHPYEPFRNEEFYQFTAFFNRSRDFDRGDDTPLLSVPADVAHWDEAAKLDRQIAEVREELFAMQPTGEAAAWQALRPNSAAATGTAHLVTREAEDGTPEVVVEGTIQPNMAFTIGWGEAEVGSAGDGKQTIPPMAPPFEGGGVPGQRPGLQRRGGFKVTAVRVEALPVDVAAALKIPEAGFCLERLTGKVIGADGAALGELKFAAAMADEATPLLDPAASLSDAEGGWASFPRLDRPRWAAFILDEPVEVPAGARLELVLQFSRTDSGNGGLCIRRLRVSASSAKSWTKLVRGERWQWLQQRLGETVAKREAIPAATAVPVMAEQPEAVMRPTFTFARGNWLDREKEVTPGVPAVLPRLPSDAEVDRLAMARWLVSPENPLTARVTVNRLWQELFGVGIVETAEDFGTSGQLPSHPELLDHLALRFQNDYAWSMKRILRAIVLSATYRQSGAATAEKAAVDPRNRLLARGPRTRLTAEMIRDQALALSGKLSSKMYGAPVMPPQPEGVWRSVYNGAQWRESEGEDRFRRAIYTYWKRTSGYPSMLTFDMPSRDVCVARRVATNTPLQALVTLNDAAYIELAQALAERLEGMAAEPAGQIAAGYRLALGAAIHPAKLELLTTLYEEAAAAFDADPTAAAKLAPTRSRYALTVVANAMLNLDDLLTK
jgi:hypothetical protein